MKIIFETTLNVRTQIVLKIDEAAAKANQKKKTTKKPLPVTSSKYICWFIFYPFYYMGDSVLNTYFIGY